MTSEPPQAEPAASGDAVTTRYPVTVIDDGDGAELCLGGVAESLPPQCGGPEVIGWDWTDHDGDYQDVAGVRWGDFKVTGAFDGTDLTVTDAVAADEWTDPPSATDVDFASPCPEPPGGWSGEPMLMFADDPVFEAARRRSDYAGGWVTQRDPRDPYELDQTLADDPEAKVLPPIVNIKVTGDAAAAEAELRKVWDGPLCVTTAERTETQLRAIQEELTTSASGTLGTSVDVLTGTVEVTTTYDDGTLQSELNERYATESSESPQPLSQPSDPASRGVPASSLTRPAGDASTDVPHADRLPAPRSAPHVVLSEDADLFHRGSASGTATDLDVRLVAR